MFTKNSLTARSLTDIAYFIAAPNLILFASAFAYIHFFQVAPDVNFLSITAVLSVALSAAGGFMVSRNVTAPVTQLVAMAKKIQKGENDFTPLERADEEIGYLQKSFISFSKVLSERELM
ncbi:MAG TPA: hypothetical protein PK467_14385, partial [Candidatus Wallbacteria bacterium]|nr:hypothetical protein [Candidatus Wallbacteria bacterium]